jgi:hypothetical protein
MACSSGRMARNNTNPQNTRLRGTLPILDTPRPQQIRSGKSTIYKSETKTLLKNNN